MLKAGIQAENLNDLPAAAATIQETLEDPDKVRFNLPVALNKMADWQLTIAGDTSAAKRTLEQIREALPGTHRRRSLPRNDSPVLMRQRRAKRPPWI